MARFLVVGSGMQGRACAFDLIRNPKTEKVLLADSSKERLASAKKWLKSPKVETVFVDASNPAAVGKLAQGYDVLVSCVPYFLNLGLAKAAIKAKCHFIDLGGNTDIVFQELKLHKEAVKAGVTLIPDNGMGPGMINTLAVHGMAKLDETDEVLIRDGGLPQKPKPPLNYTLLFSVHGLINEYVAKATAIRNGKRVQVEGLSEVEAIDLPEPLGRCEAGHASGGLSTMAWTFEGKVKNMDNKLIRLPGHIGFINIMKELGFFSETPVKINGETVVPRQVSAHLMEKFFDNPGDKDISVMRVTVRGKKNGKRAEAVYDLVDYYDEKNGITSMMRLTGFSAAIVAQMLAFKVIDKPGAYPVETGVPAGPFIDEARKRGIDIKETFRNLP
jgi:lysine 6-dehydrogenase